MINIRRDKVPLSLTDVPYVVYAVPLVPGFFEVYGNFRDALLTRWIMVRYNDQAIPIWKHFLAFKDDHDWTLFKIANGIVDEESVKIMDKNVDGDYWNEYK